MFEYLRGILVDVAPSKVTLECQGVGYGLFIPLRSLSHLPTIGKELLLYTAHVIREEKQSLYGFFTRQERTLFETLGEVSGIGPKTALALLGHMEIGVLLEAIQRADIARLCTAPGIGRRTAERLVVEKRDKLSAFPLQIPSHPLAADAMSALTNLGYSAAITQKAIQAVLDTGKNPLGLPELISSALKQITSSQGAAATRRSG